MVHAYWTVTESHFIIHITLGSYASSRYLTELMSPDSAKIHKYLPSHLRMN